MDLTISPDDEAFRQEVRAFIRDNLPKHLPREVLRLGYLAHGAKRVLEWGKILYKKGWAAPPWPVEYGGTGWTDIVIIIGQIDRRSDQPYAGALRPSLADAGVQNRRLDARIGAHQQDHLGAVDIFDPCRPDIGTSVAGRQPRTISAAFDMTAQTLDQRL